MAFDYTRSLWGQQGVEVVRAKVRLAPESTLSCSGSPVRAESLL